MFVSVVGRAVPCAPGAFDCDEARGNPSALDRTRASKRRAKGAGTQCPRPTGACPFFALKEQPGTAQGIALGKGPHIRRNPEGVALFLGLEGGETPRVGSRFQATLTGLLYSNGAGSQGVALGWYRPALQADEGAWGTSSSRPSLSCAPGASHRDEAGGKPSAWGRTRAPERRARSDRPTSPHEFVSVVGRAAAQPNAPPSHSML